MIGGNGGNASEVMLPPEVEPILTSFREARRYGRIRAGRRDGLYLAMGQNQWREYKETVLDRHPEYADCRSKLWGMDLWVFEVPDWLEVGAAA